MTTLLNLSEQNLEILSKLNGDSILLSSPMRILSIQEDFVQVDNIHELENGIYFTFYQCLSSLDNVSFMKRDALIQRMDECIDRIYENQVLNNLIDEGTYLFKIMSDIDLKLDNYKENIFYGSPFYNNYSYLCQFSEYIKNIYKNPPLLIPPFILMDKFSISPYTENYSSDEGEQDIIDGCDNLSSSSSEESCGEEQGDEDEDEDEDEGNEKDKVE